MVQTLAANRTDHPLDARTLLRHSGRSQYFLNLKFLHLLREARIDPQRSASVASPSAAKR